MSTDTTASSVPTLSARPEPKTYMIQRGTSPTLYFANAGVWTNDPLKCFKFVTVALAKRMAMTLGSGCKIKFSPSEADIQAMAAKVQATKVARDTIRSARLKREADRRAAVMRARDARRSATPTTPVSPVGQRPPKGS